MNFSLNEIACPGLESNPVPQDLQSGVLTARPTPIPSSLPNSHLLTDGQPSDYRMDVLRNVCLCEPDYTLNIHFVTCETKQNGQNIFNPCPFVVVSFPFGHRMRKSGQPAQKETRPRSSSEFRGLGLAFCAQQTSTHGR